MGLVTYMDGKAGAEKLITKALQDPTRAADAGLSAKPAEFRADAWLKPRPPTSNNWGPGGWRFSRC